MKEYFAYVRVSTTKQGEQGVSLEQQKAAIKQYAGRNGLAIRQWFEEQETAAKRGRPVFSRMLKALKAGKATGVIIHKIDRSARNLKDWADLGEIIDRGIEVHFAFEALDLNSRGGRLSADIQAVVAADFIRNLREETKKGFYGRLKQGLYPMRAVTGYVDQGKGRPKTPHPVQAPLVRKAFELYATRDYNLEQLRDEMYERGLRNRNGGKVSKNALSIMLNNPFYIGRIRLHKTKETFEGIHEPIVPVVLFQQVRDALLGKVHRKVVKHEFAFRQLFTCQLCGYHMIGELQKSTRYYRCHTKTCPTKSVREDSIEAEILRKLRLLEFSQDEKDYFRSKIAAMRQDSREEHATAAQTLKLRLSQVESRKNRLTDAFLDEVIDRESFEQRKTALHDERRQIQDQIAKLEGKPGSAVDEVSEILELAGSAYLAYKSATTEQRRRLVNIVSSNRKVEHKTPVFTLSEPFRLVSLRFASLVGSPRRVDDRVRLSMSKVWDDLLDRLFQIVAEGQPS